MRTKLDKIKNGQCSLHLGIKLYNVAQPISSHKSIFWFLYYLRRDITCPKCGWSSNKEFVQIWKNLFKLYRFIDSASRISQHQWRSELMWHISIAHVISCVIGCTCSFALAGSLGVWVGKRRRGSLAPAGLRNRASGGWSLFLRVQSCYV